MCNWSNADRRYILVHWIAALEQLQCELLKEVKNQLCIDLMKEYVRFDYIAEDGNEMMLLNQYEPTDHGKFFEKSPLA
jgi:hypothetical protein